MFDIAFSEIVVIAVVALIVIGPERLPKVARTLGHMYGRLQRYVNEVKADINREMELDELRKLRTEVQSAAQEIESSIHKAAQDTESGVRSVERELNEAAAEAPPGAPAATPVAAVPEPTPAAAPHAGAESPRQSALPGFDA
ncbi:MAG TPA: Sec-independent protein translocase protein TatB [Casimicrobiaceae bacterium]|nr:Sec-independent protein translocase protein TatB [Casimicrobiaceae bacterium]